MKKKADYEIPKMEAEMQNNAYWSKYYSPIETVNLFFTVIRFVALRKFF